jgi:hypothetical protein
MADPSLTGGMATALVLRPCCVGHDTELGVGGLRFGVAGIAGVCPMVTFAVSAAVARDLACAWARKSSSGSE